MKPSSTGIGFSHQSVPSLSNTATRSSGGTDCAAVSANATIASRVAVSFQDARPGHQSCAPLAAASIRSSAWSIVKLAAFCRGGKSLNVPRKSVTSACAAMIR